MTWKPKLIQGGGSPIVHPSATTEAPPALRLVPPPDAQAAANLNGAGAPGSLTATDAGKHELTTLPHRRADISQGSSVATVVGPGMFAMNTRGAIVNLVNSATLRAGSLASESISARPRTRLAAVTDEGCPTPAPRNLDLSNPLGCKYHKVCPSRGPIDYCDFRSLEPMTLPFDCTRDDGDHL